MNPRHSAIECLFHFILSHLSSFSVSERRISRSFFEVAREIAEIIVAAHLAYLKNRALGIREKSFCLLYSVKYQIPMQSCAERGLHKSIQMIWMIFEKRRFRCQKKKISTQNKKICPQKRKTKSRL